MQARFGSRTADLVCMGGIAFCALVLLCSESVMEAYTSMTAGHPFFMGFCKFALLATLGECLALRLTKGVYVTAGFGLIPRAVVWGCLGVAISAGFMIFSAGEQAILHLLGMEAAEQALSGPLGTTKILTAFSVSLTMNTMFAPIMMIAHKVADLHIRPVSGASGLPLECPTDRQAPAVRGLEQLLEKRAVPLPALVLDPGPYRDVPVAPVLPCPVRGCPGSDPGAAAGPVVLKADGGRIAHAGSPKDGPGRSPSLWQERAPFVRYPHPCMGTGERPAGCTKKPAGVFSGGLFIVFCRHGALARGGLSPCSPGGAAKA